MSTVDPSNPPPFELKSRYERLRDIENSYEVLPSTVTPKIRAEFIGIIAHEAK
jgi:hypothetical protein